MSPPLRCRYGHQPTELMAKRFAILGCTCLLLAQALKNSTSFRSSRYAGLLWAENEEETSAGWLQEHSLLYSSRDGMRPTTTSKRKSAALLLGRVLMALLFLAAGWKQVRGSDCWTVSHCIMLCQ